MSVYDNIKRLAKENGLTIMELEEKAGVAKGSLSHWNDGNPTAKNLLKVATVLGCSVDDILKGV